MTHPSSRSLLVLSGTVSSATVLTATVLTATVLAAAVLATAMGMVFFLSPVLAEGGCCSGPRGDVNGDGAVDTADLSALSAAIFQGGVLPDCLDAADANDDGVIDLSDLSLIGQAAYGGAPNLPELPDCTPDAFDNCCSPRVHMDPIGTSSIEREDGGGLGCG